MISMLFDNFRDFITIQLIFQIYNVDAFFHWMKQFIPNFHGFFQAKKVGCLDHVNYIKSLGKSGVFFPHYLMLYGKYNLYCLFTAECGLGSHVIRKRTIGYWKRKDCWTRKAAERRGKKTYVGFWAICIRFEKQKSNKETTQLSAIISYEYTAVFFSSKSWLLWHLSAFIYLEISEQEHVKCLESNMATNYWFLILFKAREAAFSSRKRTYCTRSRAEIYGQRIYSTTEWVSNLFFVF